MRLTTWILFVAGVQLPLANGLGTNRTITLITPHESADQFDLSDSPYLRRPNRYRRQTGSVRYGQPCQQNTDCLNYLMYCTSGTCGCTTDAVLISDFCQQSGL